MCICADFPCHQSKEPSLASSAIATISGGVLEPGQQWHETVGEHLLIHRPIATYNFDISNAWPIILLL